MLDSERVQAQIKTEKELASANIEHETQMRILLAILEVARQLALIREGLQGPLKPPRQSSVGEVVSGTKLGG